MGDFINRRRGVDERARETRKAGARLGTCIPVLGELCFGIEYSQSRDRNRKRLERALVGLACWPYTREAAEEYGRLAAPAQACRTHHPASRSAIRGHRTRSRPLHRRQRG
jgi:predicted nucleic acid-binding protein